MKQLVYATPVNTIEELTARVTQVTENIFTYDASSDTRVYGTKATSLY
jgi:hypothetical protein